ncbi:uncharacterized protein LOC143535530 [Bidens hawaiensis]|uniref:uncharacterized protein LOC143535530 n=1 Tax=Bidens hawaiensis TaxID=980011 RepID=UPI00404A172F
MNVIKLKATAKLTWDAIAHLFQDNHANRAIALKTRLTNTKLEAYPNISAYCQELKVLSDQLANVEAQISDADLVLQLVTRLTNTEYDAIGMFISQTVPLPTFSQARSRLTQEETRRTGYNSNQIAGTALLTIVNNPTHEASGRGSHGMVNESRGSHDISQRGRGRGTHGRGRGQSRGRGYTTSNQNNIHGQPAQGTYYPTYTTLWGYNMPCTNMHTPPTPHPTFPITNRPQATTGLNSQAGILSPPPQAHYSQAHYNTLPQQCAPQQFVPTNLEQAFQTTTLNPDLRWNLDSSATSHMTNTTGTLSSYFNNNIPNNIVVGNGFQIPILGTSYTKLNTAFKQLHVNNILYALNLI